MKESYIRNKLKCLNLSDYQMKEVISFINDNLANKDEIKSFVTTEDTNKLYPTITQFNELVQIVNELKENVSGTSPAQTYSKISGTI